MQGLNWKNLLYSFLGFLLPLLYTELIKSHPDFPLTSTGFTEVIVWILGLIIGGWNIASAAFKKLIYNKFGVTYAEWKQ